MPLAFAIRLAHPQRSLDLAKDRRVVDGRWRRVILAIGDLAQHRAEDLPGAGLRQPLDHHHPLEAGQRADLFADQRHQLALQLLGGDPGIVLEHHQAQRHVALEFVPHADHRALGNRLVLRHAFLHLAGGEAMPGNVYHVVGAPHDVDEAVLVEITAVAGVVVAGIVAQVGCR